jgi:hypothetical protein
VSRFVRAVLDALTLRRVLTAQAIGLLTNVLRYAENQGEPGLLSAFLLNTVYTTMASFAVLVGALCAAEAVRRGAHPLRTYSGALLAAGLCSALITAYARDELDVHDRIHGASPALTWWLELGEDVLNVVAVGGVEMLLYHNRRMVDAILDGVRGTELRRLRLERQLIESRLAAARAQIDPRALFESLAGIRSLYQSAPEEADAALEALIDDLRARRAASIVRPAGP